MMNNFNFRLLPMFVANDSVSTVIYPCESAWNRLQFRVIGEEYKNEKICNCYKKRKENNKELARHIGGQFEAF